MREDEGGDVVGVGDEQRSTELTLLVLLFVHLLATRRTSNNKRRKLDENYYQIDKMEENEGRGDTRAIRTLPHD